MTNGGLFAIIKHREEVKIMFNDLSGPLGFVDYMQNQRMNNQLNEVKWANLTNQIDSNTASKLESQIRTAYGKNSYLDDLNLMK